MTVRVLPESFRTVATPWLIVPMFEGQGRPHGLDDTALGATLQRLVESKDLAGSLGETLVVHDPGGLSARSVLVVGLGSRERASAGSWFDAGVAASKRLTSKPQDSVAVALPVEIDLALAIENMVAGLIVGSRGQDLCKTEPARHALPEVVLVVPPGTEASGLIGSADRGQIVGEAVNLARDLANTPPSRKPPRLLAERMLQQAAAVGLEVEIWDAERLKSERFGGLLAVSAGSAEPPALVQIRLRKGGESPTFALVGKGVTFDSGGLSLKPSASMEDMKADMSGGAIVLASMVAAARLGLEANVDAYIPLTENMTGGRAMKLGDVLTHRNGKTVEVMNTDAEGRLILADALSLAAERKPAGMVDLATLTGACVVALGTKVAGLFSNSDSVAVQVENAARAAGERVWRMPLDADYREQLKSAVADMKNVGGKWGGAITAAKFLEEFVGCLPWAHLDIAGPSWADGESSTRDAGATGCFVRTLIRLVESRGWVSNTG